MNIDDTDANDFEQYFLIDEISSDTSFYIDYQKKTYPVDDIDILLKNNNNIKAPDVAHELLDIDISNTNIKEIGEIIHTSSQKPTKTTNKIEKDDKQMKNEKNPQKKDKGEKLTKKSPIKTKGRKSKNIEIIPNQVFLVPITPKKGSKNKKKKKENLTGKNRSNINQRSQSTDEKKQAELLCLAQNSKNKQKNEVLKKSIFEKPQKKSTQVDPIHKSIQSFFCKKESSQNVELKNQTGLSYEKLPLNENPLTEKISKSISNASKNNQIFSNAEKSTKRSFCNKNGEISSIQNFNSNSNGLFENEIQRQNNPRLPFFSNEKTNENENFQNFSFSPQFHHNHFYSEKTNQQQQQQIYYQQKPPFCPMQKSSSEKLIQTQCSQFCPMTNSCSEKIVQIQPPQCSSLPNKVFNPIQTNHSQFTRIQPSQFCASSTQNFDDESIQIHQMKRPNSEKLIQPSQIKLRVPSNEIFIEPPQNSFCPMNRSNPNKTIQIQQNQFHQFSPNEFNNPIQPHQNLFELQTNPNFEDQIQSQKISFNQNCEEPIQIQQNQLHQFSPNEFNNPIQPHQNLYELKTSQFFEDQISTQKVVLNQNCEDSIQNPTSTKLFFEESIQSLFEAQNKAQQRLEDQIKSKIFYTPSLFSKAMLCDELFINPYSLKFEPETYWINYDQEIQFRILVNTFFRVNNTRITRFIYKLYNMLLITSKVPLYKSIVGVNWITNKIFSVNVENFAAMINLSSFDVDSILNGYNKNIFYEYKFIEVNDANYLSAGLAEMPQLPDSKIKLMFHTTNKFVNRELSLSELDEIESKYGKKHSLSTNNMFARYKYPAFS